MAARRAWVERAMRSVMPADGQWHRINVTPWVHTGTGAVRLQFSCQGRESAVVELSAVEMDEAIRRGILLNAEPMGRA